jgi:hypothetical protein
VREETDKIRQKGRNKERELKIGEDPKRGKDKRKTQEVKERKKLAYVFRA